MRFGDLEEYYDRGYREFGGDVITKGQAQELANEKNTGCLYWPASGVFEFMPYVFKRYRYEKYYFSDPIVVRATR